MFSFIYTSCENSGGGGISELSFLSMAQNVSSQFPWSGFDFEVTIKDPFDTTRTIQQDDHLPGRFV